MVRDLETGRGDNFQCKLYVELLIFARAGQGFVIGNDGWWMGLFEAKGPVRSIVPGYIKYLSVRRKCILFGMSLEF
jgi:hypothetical protein